MTASSKFLFDVSFDSDAPGAPEPTAAPAPEPAVEAPAPPPEPTFSAAELAAARAEGEALGRAAAAEEARTAAEQAIALSLEQVASRLEDLLKGLRAVDEENRAQCLRLSLAILRKLFPRLAASNGLSEIEQVIGDSLERLRDEPRIVIRVADSLLDGLRERIDGLTRRGGFEGKTVLISEAGLPPGAVRVEWADGGAEREPESNWSAIEALIEKALPQVPTAPTAATPRAAPPAETPQTAEPKPVPPFPTPEGRPMPPAEELAARA